MKRLCLGLLATGLIGIVCGARMEQRSASGAAGTPCVGYVKVALRPGALTLVGVQFDALDGSPLTFGELFGDQLPCGSSVVLFEKRRGRYRFIRYGVQGWPEWAEDMPLPRGTGMWIHVPMNAKECVSCEFVQMGRVPNDDETRIKLSRRWNLVAYPYPAEMAWQDTKLAQESTAGAALVVWDADAARFRMARKMGGQWRGANDIVLGRGTGFFYRPGRPTSPARRRWRNWRRRARETVWVEPRPYPVCGMAVFEDEEAFAAGHKEVYGSFYGGWNWGIVPSLPGGAPPPPDLLVTPDMGSLSSSSPLGSSGDGAIGGNGNSADYSDTNTQVDGVGEPDIVKTDGEFIYAIAGGRLIITRAYPIDDSEIVANLPCSGMVPREMFVAGDRLLLISNGAAVTATLFDISDRSAPEILKTVSLAGEYNTSRQVGPYAYLVANSIIRNARLPVYSEDGKETCLAEISQIGKIAGPDAGRRLITILSVHIRTGRVRRSVLSGWVDKVYCSHNNLYLAHNGGSTTVSKIHISRGLAGYVGQGTVPGGVLNQFSMDEFRGRFRIATTDANWRYNGSNHVHVLDHGMEIEGAIKGIAPGEKIYSARFMGEKAYLVTFKKVDPFFVIDLADPSDPRILGKLKIPGYSNYLHPMPDNHIMGIGKHTVPSTFGDFAWYQGLKIAIYDVTNVTNPIEKCSMIVGDRGSESEALSDHHALLYSAEKNLLVLPAQIRELPEGMAPLSWRGYPNHGTLTFHGAIVFDISPEAGISERGRVSHSGTNGFGNSVYWRVPHDAVVRRSLYIGDVLYTVSGRRIKANALDTLEQLQTFEFSSE